MASIRRNGDVMSAHVGKLEVARVTGLGTHDPRIKVRTKGGFWRTVASIDDRQAENDLREYADLCEWVLSEERRGNA